jgi:hypothetical protein
MPPRSLGRRLQPEAELGEDAFGVGEASVQVDEAAVAALPDRRHAGAATGEGLGGPVDLQVLVAAERGRGVPGVDLDELGVADAQLPDTADFLSHEREGRCRPLAQVEREAAPNRRRC